MKLDNYVEYLRDKKEMKRYLDALGDKITLWGYEKKTTLKISIKLNPETFEEQVTDLVDLSMDFMDAQLKTF